MRLLLLPALLPPALLLAAAAPAPAPNPAPQPPAYAASGNEPFWSLRITGDEARLTLLGDPAPHTATLSPPRTSPDGSVRDGTAGTTPLAVAIAPGPCQDTMTGLPHPDRVRVTLGARTLEGCGGPLAARLTGAPWTLATIAGAPAAGEKPATLRFEENGRMGGQGACNTYAGEWRLEGERLVFGRMISTMMACPEPAMDQDMKLFRLLETATAWRIGEQGELVIEGEGGSLTARR